MTNCDHTFVICAYQENPYLEVCIRSLINQTAGSRVIIATSTPNEHIASLARKYGLEMYVNKGRKGLSGDWNFARSAADSKYVTIAHQDDFYSLCYAENILKAAEKNPDAVILFTDYFEIRGGKKADPNRLIKIKRLMLSVIRVFPKSIFARNLMLSFGNPICCPAVTFSTEKCRNFKFSSRFRFSADWEAWIRLAQKRGSFVYIPRPLMGHRIYPESTTTKMIENNVRYGEELTLFRLYWPKPIAKLIMKFFSRASESNK